MSERCSICNHKHSRLINELLEANKTLQAISDCFGGEISVPSLSRHHNNCLGGLEFDGIRIPPKYLEGLRARLAEIEAKKAEVEKLCEKQPQLEERLSDLTARYGFYIEQKRKFERLEEEKKIGLILEVPRKIGDSQLDIDAINAAIAHIEPELNAVRGAVQELPNIVKQTRHELRELQRTVPRLLGECLTDALRPIVGEAYRRVLKWGGIVASITGEIPQGLKLSPEQFYISCGPFCPAPSFLSEQQQRDMYLALLSQIQCKKIEPQEIDPVADEIAPKWPDKGECQVRVMTPVRSVYRRGGLLFRQNEQSQTIDLASYQDPEGQIRLKQLVGDPRLRVKHESGLILTL